MAHYIHHVPGRLRVNTPTLKKNESRARQLKSHLEGMNGVLQAEASIVTGSVVIKYDTCLVSSTLILDSLYDLGYIQNTTTLSGPAHGTPAMQKVAEVFVQKFVETALERSAVALVAALI
jgi:copper chaperone CopZ